MSQEKIRVKIGGHSLLHHYVKKNIVGENAIVVLLVGMKAIVVVGMHNDYHFQAVQPLAIGDGSRIFGEVAYSPTVDGGGGGMSGQRLSITIRNRDCSSSIWSCQGKEDLGAISMFGDSVTKLKSPKASTCISLSKRQVDLAIDNFGDRVYDCFGLVWFSCLEHPKFKAFLNGFGFPSVSKKELAGKRLDL